jgi:DNA-binding response OmpR family regulator
MNPLPIPNVQPDRYQDTHLELNFPRRSARVDSRRLRLTRKEFDLLALLVRNAGDLIPRQHLLMWVWGYGPQIRTRTLDVHIRRLRKKLGPSSEPHVETVVGVGYRFQPQRMAAGWRSGPAMGLEGMAIPENHS